VASVTSIADQMLVAPIVPLAAAIV
jgi:hypothetical protein